MNVNMVKFKALISYIISRCKNKKNVGKTVICKLAYFSDFNHYEIYEKPITNETYIKFDKGPLPKHFLELINEMKKNNELYIEEKPYGTNKIQNFYLKNPPDITIFNNDELSVIDDVIDTLSNMSATKISKYSHGDMPWIVAEDQEELDYEYVFYRDDTYSVRMLF